MGLQLRARSERVMAEMQPKYKQLCARFLAELKRDKKRAAVLGVAVIVAVFVFAKLLMGGSTPARATGRSAGATAVQQSGQAAPAGTSLAAADDPGQPSPRSGFLAVRTISRDLFSPNDIYFPPEQTGTTEAQIADGAASADAEAELHKKMVLAQAQSLSLQSTMISDSATVIINGRVLRVGEWINGFQVKEVAPMACTIEKEGVSVALKMSQ